VVVTPNLQNERSQIVFKKPYQPRAIRFLEIWEDKDWTVKIYGAAYQGHPDPSPELMEAAKEIARSHIHQTPEDEERYGLGFMIIHQGRRGNYICVDYWIDGTELFHHFYGSSFEHPTVFKPIPVSEFTLCVWDSRVISFERDAWMNSILANPNGADVEQYLASRLNEDC
jgi:hypothetical protein